jgi:hypothetical protein
MNEKTIKAIGIAATLIGIGASLISAWTAEKQNDERIEQKVHEAMMNLEKSLEKYVEKLRKIEP